MATLTKAHDELFRRNPDERFPTFLSLHAYCQREKEYGKTHWYDPEAIHPVAQGGALQLGTDGDVRRLTDWSFSQLCRLAEVDRGTVNRLSPATASKVFSETLPKTGKPLQVFTAEKLIRSVHGVTYTRLHNADVLDTVAEWAEGFMPPQEAAGGGTGLYCGEQDMFCFLIDPTGWVDIGDQAFAPGFFVWNSEVGRRTVGIQSFWFQKVCQNHIVWDATNVTEFTRKHTSNVDEALESIREIIGQLVEARDARRDSFARMMQNAMRVKLGSDADEVLKRLGEHGFSRVLAQEALKLAADQGAFTVYSVVDALTRISQRQNFAGGRTEADAKASQLLQLAA